MTSVEIQIDDVFDECTEHKKPFKNFTLTVASSFGKFCKAFCPAFGKDSFYSHRHIFNYAFLFWDRW